jgi:hypothetical protein
MPGRKVGTAQEAAALLEEVAASGIERAEWARRRGIDPRSLNAWRVNLARRSRTQLQLVELVPTALPTNPGVVVRCGRFAVEVDDDFDDGVLRRVLAAVAAC